MCLLKKEYLLAVVMKVIWIIHLFTRMVIMPRKCTYLILMTKHTSLTKSYITLAIVMMYVVYATNVSLVLYQDLYLSFDQTKPKSGSQKKESPGHKNRIILLITCSTDYLECLNNASRYCVIRSSRCKSELFLETLKNSDNSTPESSMYNNSISYN